MRYATLADWLAWQETLHPAKIDMGLERVHEVLQRLGLQNPPYVVITVAGTNGKGSCVAMLEAMLRAAGYRIGAYTSPHLLRYNERIRIDRIEASDEALCQAFCRIDAARGETSLTYFEFGTLAALDIFARADLDAVILEVGMGGRLDAVNVLDPDVAVITTVGIDHVAWLGSDRERIGAEKAGILRPGRFAVYGGEDPPASVVERARAMDAPFHCFGRDFGYERHNEGWSWWGMGQRRDALPMPQLRGPFQLNNAAAAIAALTLVNDRLPVLQQALREGLNTVALPGRLQPMDSEALRICDVAHNPQAAAALADGLRGLPRVGRTHAVVAMLADKDVAGVVGALADGIDIWHTAGLVEERGADAAAVAAQVRSAVDSHAVHEYATVAAALIGATAAAAPGERIVVFGSFYTVAIAMDPRHSAWWRTGSGAG